MSVEGKVIAITGASSGIGEAAALLLAERGAKVVLGARRTDRLEKLAKAIEAKGGQARFRALDVTSLEDTQAFIDFAKAEFGTVDVIVNNAGVMPLSRLDALKRDEWKRMIDVNVHGVLNGIAAVLPRFTAQGRGHVVNVASVAAHMVAPTAAVYCGTKYAVWAITEGLRMEHDDIRTTIISPGVVATELGDDISVPEIAEGLKQWRQKSLTPDAIARAIAYAIAQPDGVDVSEIIVRPAGGAF